jgi:hypothetical protein
MFNVFFQADQSHLASRQNLLQLRLRRVCAHSFSCALLLLNQAAAVSAARLRMFAYILTGSLRCGARARVVEILFKK